MKLTDVKKLKVAELRSRLTALGLDSRGLKAELVDRLWTATLSGLDEDTKKADKVEIERETRLDPVYNSSEAETGLSQTRETDINVEISSQLTGISVAARCEVEQAKKFTDTATQTEPAPPDVDPERESGCRGSEEGGGDPPEHASRGRAFYEFKEEIRYKRAKPPQFEQEEEVTRHREEEKIAFNSYDCHLHFEVSPNGSCGQPRFWSRFSSLWSGCRLTHGVRQGMVGFEVKLEKNLLMSQSEGQETGKPFGLRVGWSVADTSLLLGETDHSFAYDGCGKKISGGKEETFGEAVSEGDVIGCYASFSTDHVELSYHKNGRFMGVAFSLSISRLLGRALYPHVLCRRCSVRLLSDSLCCPSPPGYTPLSAHPARESVRSTAAPTSKTQCEVVMMVGLPGSGKTFWARGLIRERSDKQYKLLGTEELLACMIDCDQEDQKMQQACQCLTEIIKIAARTPGNYILDQCNVLFSSLHCKLKLFAGFRRRVVVVFPSADEWKRRLQQHQSENNEHIPDAALLKLQVSCSLPELQLELLEELEYVELPQGQAQTLLQQYKGEARRQLPTVSMEKKKRPRSTRKRPFPFGPPPSKIWQWPFYQGWNNPRPVMQVWAQQLKYDTPNPGD